mmetsp:Transcript_49392/g.105114  ORF Transcript_49392/g.105114 Transcript_49392/m.105114 type:complete len:246 (+) Transcript_49392:111-848(+)
MAEGMVTPEQQDPMLSMTKSMVAALQILQQREAAATVRAEEEAQARAVATKRAAEADAAYRSCKAEADQLRAENAQMLQEMEKIKQDYLLVHASHVQAKEAMKSALQAQEAFRAEQLDSKEALEEAHAQLARQEEELVELRANRTTMIEAAKRINDLQVQVNEKDVQLCRKDEEIENLSRQLEQSRLQNEASEKELATAKEALASKESAISECQKELQGFKGTSRDVQMELRKVQHLLKGVPLEP